MFASSSSNIGSGIDERYESAQPTSFRQSTHNIPDSHSFAFPSFPFREERFTGNGRHRHLGVHQTARRSSFNVFIGEPSNTHCDEEVAQGHLGSSQKAVRSMSSLKVKSLLIHENGKCQCEICLENVAVDESATRLPCHHLFHKDCADTCLTSSKRCPICRYELPADDLNLETECSMRMSNSEPRLHSKDLFMNGFPELQYRAQHLGVDASECLQKAELVEPTASSGCTRRISQVYVVDELLIDASICEEPVTGDFVAEPASCFGKNGMPLLMDLPACSERSVHVQPMPTSVAVR